MAYDPNNVTHREIAGIVGGSKVALFMKGSPAQPMCGFSATAAKILELNGVGEYASVDVLQNPVIREAAKEFASWPTFPQLYVNGEFVGGADIMREMHASGELGKLLHGK